MPNFGISLISFIFLDNESYFLHLVFDAHASGIQELIFVDFYG